MTATEQEPIQGRTAGEVMTANLLTVCGNDTVLMAWELMRRGNFHHLPVVTDDGRLVGVVDAETVERRWEAGGPDRNRRPVSDLLGRSRPTVAPSDGVGTVALMMLGQRTEAIAVVDPADRLLGLVTTHDLLALLGGKEPTARSAAKPNPPALYRIVPILPPGEGAADRTSVEPE